MLKNIILTNFRNYNNLEISLAPGINVFLGKNAQGKTNLLESIFFMSNTRSYRTSHDQDLINIKEEYARIIIDYNNKKLMCVLHDKGKYFEIENNPVKLTSDFIGQLKTILFYPNESELFTASPRIRRNFIDSEISKVSKDYLINLQTYNRLLKDRNKLLKEKEINLDLIEVITKQLIDVQIFILDKRIEFTDHVAKEVDIYFNKLSKNEATIKTVYHSNLAYKDKEAMYLLYQESLQRDIFYGSTQEGIHRDDINFYINDIEVYKYASQGQGRLILFSIKLSLINYIKNNCEDRPILLLDDVLSELDEYHQISLIESIPPDIQTIITSTDQFDIFNKIENIQLFRISNGTIEIEGV